MKRCYLNDCLILSALLLAGCQGEPHWHGKDIAGLMPELEFELIDERNTAVTADRFNGDAVLLFFGFTHCPDVCPLTLAKLSAAVNKLPQPQQEQVRILFVSVDPERDTPKRLVEYTDAFHPRMIGLTGSQQQLRALTKRYRVTYGYDQPDADGNYNVSHSSAVFAFDREHRVRLLLRDDLSVDELQEDIARLAGA